MGPVAGEPARPALLDRVPAGGGERGAPAPPAGHVRAAARALRGDLAHHGPLGGREPYPDEAGGGLACYFRDITGRREAEAERERLLREAEEARDTAERAAAAAAASEARYRTLFDTIDEGFCVIEMLFDAEGRPVDYRFLEVEARRSSGRRGS